MKKIKIKIKTILKTRNIVMAILFISMLVCPLGCKTKSFKQVIYDDTAKTINTAGLKGQKLADNLMDQWKRENPDRNWVEIEKEHHTIKPGADNSNLLNDGQGKGHAYGNYSKQDLIIWARETEKFVVAGSKIFHDANALNSKVSVSCDMCHPDASNTHPETYPKFQVQMGRSVLLRDMINWCIENPVRGKHLDGDDFKLRALEAYIIAQRRGVKLDYNKH